MVRCRRTLPAMDHIEQSGGGGARWSLLWRRRYGHLKLHGLINEVGLTGSCSIGLLGLPAE